MKTLLVAICMMCVLPQLAGLFVSNPLARMQHSSADIAGKLTALHASVVRPTIFEEMKYEQVPFRAKTEASEVPLGIDIPELTAEDKRTLQSGGRVQMQQRSGRAGTGWVVVEVLADPDLVFAALTDFRQYTDMIPTVRGTTVYYEAGAVCKAQYLLSKFRLKINAEQEVFAQERVIRFALDADKPNAIMHKAEGYWWVQQSETEGCSRVWLSANIVASRLVPTLLVDYTACRALPRATSWIQPHFQQLGSRSRGESVEK